MTKFLPKIAPSHFRMELNENRRGYWSGMPARLKARVLGWTIYWLVAAWMVSQGMLLGFVLLVAPIFWWLFKLWLLQTAGADDVDRDGLISYSLDYVWGSSIYVRSFVMVSFIAFLAGGLGWLGAETILEPEPEPTFAERAAGAFHSASDSARDIASASKETTSDWLERAKGWFD